MIKEETQATNSILKEILKTMQERNKLLNRIYCETALANNYKGIEIELRSGVEEKINSNMYAKVIDSLENTRKLWRNYDEEDCQDK